MTSITGEICRRSSWKGPSLVLLAEGASSQQAGFLMQYDLGASRVGNCPYWSTDMTLDCHWDSYRARLLTWALPNVALGGVLCLSVVIYLLCRYILDCCGGRRSAPNFCLPNHFLLSRYSKGDLLRPLLWCLAAAAGSFAVLIWGGTSATDLRRSMSEMRHAGLDAVERLQAMASRLAEALQQVRYEEVTPTGTTGTATAVWSTNADDDAMQMAVKAVVDHLMAMEAMSVGALTSFVTRHLWAAYTIETLTLLCCVLGVLAALCHCTGQVPMMVFGLLCVLGTLTWCYSGHLSASFHLLEDSCREVSYYTLQQTNVLRVVTNCTVAGPSTSAALAAAETLPLGEVSDAFGVTTMTSFELLKRVYLSQVESFSNASCVELRQMCPDIFLSLSSSSVGFPLGGESLKSGTEIEEACAAVSVSQLRVALSVAVTSTSTPDNNNNVCGAGVSLSDAQRTALKSRREAIDDLLSHLTLWSPVTSCDGVLALSVPPLLQTCVNGMAHHQQLLWSCGVLGWCSLVGMFAVGMGSKRFLPLHTALEAVAEEELDWPDER